VGHEIAAGTKVELGEGALGDIRDMQYRFRNEPLLVKRAISKSYRRTIFSMCQSSEGYRKNVNRTCGFFNIGNTHDLLDRA
jgi:hypothetical protein